MTFDEITALAETVADDLQGTCQSMDAALEKVGIEDFADAPMALLQEIDQRVFCCADCGWWHELGEAHEGSFMEDVCGDCYAIQEDEEDD
jgi:hypothetical protein